MKFTVKGLFLGKQGVILVFFCQMEGLECPNG